MKGILLAGGAGKRLYPLTLTVSKQLLPVFDKPMIYYPLSVLMLAGIREVLIISDPRHAPLFQHLLGDGSRFGMKLSYGLQPSPGGLPEAFLIGQDFLAGEPVCLILGDNIFYGDRLRDLLREAATLRKGCRVFCYRVKEAARYGVVEIDEMGTILSIEEKPHRPKSNFALTGIYFCDETVSAMARKLEPSARGELEITDIIKGYWRQGDLKVDLLSRGMAWLDTGTHEALLQSGNFIETIENRQGLKVACLEEIAFRQKWIDGEQVLRMADQMGADYLRQVVKAGPGG